MASNLNFSKGELEVKESIENFWHDSKLIPSNVTKEDDGRKTHEYLWIIDNYNKVEIGIIYQSHQIIIGGAKHYLCLKRIRLNSKSVSNPLKFEVKVVMKLFPPIKTNLTLKFNAIDYSKKVYFCQQYNKEDYYFIKEEPYLTVDARLQIICSITLDENIEVQAHQPLSELQNYLSLSEDFDGLLIGGEYSDVSIIVGRNEFNVHRCVLASRSKVFAKMLEVDMVEKNKGKIIIEDCSGEVFYEFLIYLYSGKLKISSEERAFKFLELGEKYCIKQLKSVACSYLSYCLKVSNVIDLYKLSELYNMPELKIAAVQFISLNLLEVIKDPDWDAIRGTDSLLDSLIPIVAKRTAENIQVIFQDYRPTYNLSDSNRYIDHERDQLFKRMSEPRCAFNQCGISSYDLSDDFDSANEIKLAIQNLE